MAILNLTPDSFSDGGRARTLDAAIARAERLTLEGAEILDIGGESSRPGAAEVPVVEEIDRVIPAIEALATRIDIPISVDTAKPEVARLALAAGASIINDIRGLDTPGMAGIVAESGAGVVLMHMQGTPRTMQDNPSYGDVVAEVMADLRARVDRAVAAGIDRERIAIDPGIGFGKTNPQSLALLRHLDAFAAIGPVLLIGTSRKGFLGKITGRAVEHRAVASAASALAAASLGARVVRVHDVAETVDALRVWEAQRGW